MIFLDHAGPTGFSPFDNTSEGIQKFADCIKKVGLKKFGNQVDNINLLGCEVTLEFAEKLESKLGGVRVKILPPVQNSGLLLADSPALGGKGFMYGALDSSGQYFEKPIAEGKIDWLMQLMKTPEEFRKKLKTFKID